MDDACDKFLRFQAAQITDEVEIRHMNRAARSWTMPIFNGSETPRHRTRQQAPVDQTSRERLQSLSDNTHAGHLS